MRAEEIQQNQNTSFLAQEQQLSMALIRNI
jgi:hypothetical protein